MKKCASCTKDLPDAALHCVFCGAKQAPAPVVANANAKTVMGYSANEMIDQLKQQGVTVPARPARPEPSPPGPSQQQPMVPPSSANAATMFVPGSGPPPAIAPYAAQPAPIPAPISAPVAVPMMPGAMPVRPVEPIPAAPPYLASRTAARAGRPIEPWKDGLRLMMFVWGAVLLVAFATPLATDPLMFNWDLIINGEGTMKLPPLIIAAVGLLSIVIGAIPMAPTPRGAIAALLGLAGVFVPVAMIHGLEWQLVAILAGMAMLIPGLLVRAEYRDATLPRILVTIGALITIVPFVIPENGGAIPLVELFSALIHAPGVDKAVPALFVAQLILVVLSLLVWLPAPASGGAKLFAWLLILWGLVATLVPLLAMGHLSDVVGNSPAVLVSWAAGEVQGFPVLGVAYAALLGYGLATVIGKQLE